MSACKLWRTQLTGNARIADAFRCCGTPYTGRMEGYVRRRAVTWTATVFRGPWAAAASTPSGAMPKTGKAEQAMSGKKRKGSRGSPVVIAPLSSSRSGALMILRRGYCRRFPVRVLDDPRRSTLMLRLPFDGQQRTRAQSRERMSSASERLDPCPPGSNTWLNASA